MATRKQRQGDLLFKLGLVLSPLYDIVEHPENYDATARSRAAGKFSADKEKLRQEITRFAQDDPGHLYERERQLFHAGLNSIQQATNNFLHDNDKLKPILEAQTTLLQEIILSIPALTEAVALEAHTPFSSYSLIKDLCQAIGQRVILTDRYLTGTVYYRFFRDIPKSAHVTLVTWSQTKRKPAEWTDLIDVSRMYAAERTNSYRLVVNDKFHDRRLWLDDQIYLLGGSLKDAGKNSALTIAKLDNTPQIRQELEDAINNGTELFGPTQQTHP